MSDPERGENEAGRELGAGVGAEDEFEEVEDEPRNPFDNPYFLPVLLGAFALWCGWDGFISDKFADRPGTLWFNRVAFAVLGAAAAWLTVRARRETSASRDPDAS